MPSFYVQSVQSASNITRVAEVDMSQSEQAEGTKSSSNTGAEVDTSKSKGTNSSSNTGAAETGLGALPSDGYFSVQSNVQKQKMRVTNC